MGSTVPRASLGRATLFLCLKFLVLAPICLVLWMLLLPAYTWFLGNATGLFLKYVAQVPILAVVVGKAAEGTATTLTDGPLVRFFMIIAANSRTELTFQMADRWPTMRDVALLVTNVAPFLALVLATPGLRILRRLRVFAIGFVFLFLTHAVTIVLRFMSGGRTELPTAVGFLSVTLPFLLWIVLAYWDKLIAYLGDNEGEASSKKGGEGS